jgi:hypothetical protein
MDVSPSYHLQLSHPFTMRRDRHSPVLEDDFFNIVFHRIYDPISSDLSPKYFSKSLNLAILCFVLAIGLLLDPEEPPLSSEAAQYYEMGCAAMSLDSPLEQRSISAIQALVSR